MYKNMSPLKQINRINTCLQNFKCGLRLQSTYSANDQIQPVFVNRNPRNLEKMYIAQKPDGYHLEKPGKSFWNKLQLIPSGRHITANILHHTNGVVITASTKEWAIKKHLYKTTDMSAYINLARVLAQRCHQFGIIEVRCDIKGVEGGKIQTFLKKIEEEGLILSEQPQFKPHRPWDKDRAPKPWEYEY